MQMDLTYPGGRRRARAAFASHVVIMDEPTAALGVKESAKVLELIVRVRDSGLPVILNATDTAKAPGGGDE